MRLGLNPQLGRDGIADASTPIEPEPYSGFDLIRVRILIMLDWFCALNSRI